MEDIIERALRKTTDTKACVIRAGATESAARMFKGFSRRRANPLSFRIRGRVLSPALLDRLFGKGGVWEV